MSTVFQLGVYSVDSGCVCGARPLLMSYFSASSDGCNRGPHWVAQYIKGNLAKGGDLGGLAHSVHDPSGVVP